MKNKKKTIGLIHGVFDVIHVGHINYFKEAKSKVDKLIVSVTSDKFVIGILICLVLLLASFFVCIRLLAKTAGKRVISAPKDRPVARQMTEKEMMSPVVKVYAQKKLIMLRNMLDLKISNGPKCSAILVQNGAENAAERKNSISSGPAIASKPRTLST